MPLRPISRVCIATSYAANVEPRAPRFAAVVARLLPNAEVTFVDCVPQGLQVADPAAFNGIPNLRRHTVFHAWNGGGRLQLAALKARNAAARLQFRVTGQPSAAAFTTRGVELGRYLQETSADLYGGFNIDALLPVWETARDRQAPFFFDCQEFYSDMDPGQSATERALIRETERRCLPDCALVLAATPQIADRLSEVYGIPTPLALYNAPPVHNGPLPQPSGAFSLYWRNGVIDLGSRGLSDALRALALLPRDIHLYIQGRTALDGGRRVQSMVAELGLADRVVTLAPYDPADAVRMAACHSVGLCPEQMVAENIRLTASNKIFDYLMAGLAVVASDGPGLREVVERSEAGLLYPSGDSAALAEHLHRLYTDRALLTALRQNARSFALAEGNLEFQANKLSAALEQRVLRMEVVSTAA